MSADITFVKKDCFKGLEEDLEPNSIDVVVTSPPYNLDIDYNEFDDSSDREKYLSWMQQWGKKVSKILSDQGSIFLNLGSKPSNPWGPHEVIMRLRETFVLQNEIHWIKSIVIQENSYGEDIDVNVGHFKPINSDRYLNQCHEYIFHLSKNGDVQLDRTAIGVPYKDKSNIDRWNSVDQDLRCRGNTWYIPYKTIQDRNEQRPHPASFPPELAEKAFKLHGLDKIDRGLDPFMGIGNSARAAAKLNIDFTGFEIDEQYLEEARSNIGDVQKELF